MPAPSPPRTLPNPVRVQFIIGQLTLGGSERHVCDLALHLDRERFAPSVLSLRPGGPLAQVLREADVPCEEIPVLKAPLPGVDVFKAVRRFSPHVVCVYTYVDKLWGRLAAILAGTPVILSAYRTRRRPWYERLLLPRTTAVVGNSQALLEEFHRLYAYPRERLHFLPNGVDLERFAPNAGGADRQALDLPAEVPVVAMVARFAPVKDHETALRALALLRQNLPTALLLLVGHGPEEPRLRTLTRELRLEGAVRFLPARTPVPQVFAAANAVLLSSRSESLPRVLVEAAACGRPAVATDVGGCAEVVQDGVSGSIVPPNNPAAMALALERLLADHTTAARMGAAARELACRHYSLPAMTRRFEALCLAYLQPEQVRTF